MREDDSIGSQRLWLGGGRSSACAHRSVIHILKQTSQRSCLYYDSHISIEFLEERFWLNTGYFFTSKLVKIIFSTS